MAALERGLEAALAAERDIHGEALGPQGAADEARDVRLVVDDEDPTGGCVDWGVRRERHACIDPRP